MAGEAAGTAVRMDEERDRPDERDRPTINQPLNAPPRTSAKSVLIVLGILAVAAVVMVVIGWLRYNT
jgi:hypothetical protein